MGSEKKERKKERGEKNENNKNSKEILIGCGMRYVQGVCVRSGQQDMTQQIWPDSGIICTDTRIWAWFLIHYFHYKKC